MGEPARILDVRRGLWLTIARRMRAGDPGPVMTACADGGYGLLLRVRAGDPQAQDVYVRSFWPDVERDTGYYGARGGVRDDLLGEGALALWEAAFDYDPGRHRTEPGRYVRNQIHRSVRRAYLGSAGPLASAAKVLPLHPDAAMPIPADPLSAVEQRLDLERAIERLPERDRHLLSAYLSLIGRDGVGPEEAARRMAAHAARSPQAVKKQVQRVRGRLRRWLTSK